MTWIRSPISEISCPVHSRLKLRLANRRRYGDWRRMPAASAPASETSAGIAPASAYAAPAVPGVAVAGRRTVVEPSA